MPSQEFRETTPHPQGAPHGFGLLPSGEYNEDRVADVLADPAAPADDRIADHAIKLLHERGHALLDRVREAHEAADVAEQDYPVDFLHDALPHASQPKVTSRNSITQRPTMVPIVATRSCPLRCVSGMISSLIPNSLAPAASPL